MKRFLIGIIINCSLEIPLIINKTRNFHLKQFILGTFFEFNMGVPVLYLMYNNGIDFLIVIIILLITIICFISIYLIIINEIESSGSSLKKYRFILVSLFLIIAFICALIWQIYFDVSGEPDYLTIDLFSISHVSIFIVMFVFFDAFFPRKRVIWGLIIIGVAFEIFEYLLATYFPITRVLTWESLNNALADIPFNLLGIYIGYSLVNSKENSQN